MAETFPFLAEKRYAVVTGANKGLGFEVCRQLSSKGIVVILTSRDEKRGLEAVDSLRNSGISSGNIEFHQLDVTDHTSVSSFADYIKAKIGKLDILVNNAGIFSAIADFDALIEKGFPQTQNFSPDMVVQTYEQAQECLETNYYGVKRCTLALLPLLQLSVSPRIINVSSSAGKLCNIQNEGIRGILDNTEELTEARLDKVVEEFLKDFKDDLFVQKGWFPFASAYYASKAALNAYTRILAKNNPTVIINCLCPGYLKTDFSGHTGNVTTDEGASRTAGLALVRHGSPSGLFYTNNQVTPF